MKRLKIISISLALLISCLGSEATAQSFFERQKSTLNQRKDYNKERDKFNKTRVSKKNQKTAKDMEGRGWRINGGNPDLAYQLQVKDDYTTFRDEENNLIYICGSGSGDAKTREKATLIAEQMAQRQLMGQIETKLGSLTKGGLTGDTYDIESATKTLIAGIIKRADVIYNVFKLANGTYTVEQVWAVNASAVENALQEEAKQQNKKDLKNLQNELDDAIDF